MIESLRELISKSKEGDKCGKFVTKSYIPCAIHCNVLILLLFDGFKIPHCRKLCP